MSSANAQKALGYVRSRFSIQGNKQYENIKNYCSETGIELIDVFLDIPKIEGTGSKPDFDGLITFLQKYRGCTKLLVVENFDRFGRNKFESIDLIESLEKKIQIKVVSINGSNVSSSIFKLFTMEIESAIVNNEVEGIQED